MASDPQNSKRTLSRLIPKRFGAVGIAAGMLIAGAGEIGNTAQPAQGGAPKVAKDDKTSQEVLSLISEMETALTYVGEIKPKVSKEEIQGHISKLGSVDFSERDNAHKELIEIGYQAKPELKKALTAPDAEIARRAALVLKAFKDIDDERAARLQGPVRGLGFIGAAAKEAVPTLIEVLKEDNSDIRWWAALTLAYIGPGAEAAVPGLRELLKDQDHTVRVHVAECLGGIGPGAKFAVPALIEALKDREQEVTRAAATSLGKIGPDAKAAVPQLLDAVKNSEDADTRQAAITSLGQIRAEPKTVMPALIDAFKDADSQVRLAAAEALGQFGPEAKGAVPALSEGLRDTSLWVTREVINALVRIGPDAKEAIPALTAFKDSTPNDHEIGLWGQYTAAVVRQEAAAAIESIAKARCR